MADERNVIEIILQARDETSAAFASLAAKMGLQKEISKELARENKNLEDSTRSLGAQTERSRVSFDALRQSMGRQKTDFTDNIKLTGELARAYADVEDATKRAVDAQDRRTSSLAKQAAAEAAATAAQRELSRVLRAQINDLKGLGDEEKKYLLAAATRHADSVRQGNEDIALNQRRKRSIEEAAAAQEKADADSVRSAAQAARTRQQAAAKEARDEEVVARARQQRNRDDLAYIQRLESQRAAAARAEKTRNDAEVADVQRASSALRQYQNEIQKVANLKKEAASKNLTDVEKLTIEVDSTRALRQATVLKAELERLLTHVSMNVDLDSAVFEEHAADVEAIKVLLGRDIHINVDVDAAAATAKLAAFQCGER